MLDPQDPIDLHPATEKVAQAADARRRLGVLERRQLETDWQAPEPNRRVGAVGQPAFNAGWASSIDGTTGQTIWCEFYKTAEGLVLITGMVIYNGGSSIQIFRLPVGYRPAIDAYYTGRAPGAVSQAVNVRRNGDVEGVAALGQVTMLDGIVFRAL